MKKRDYLTIIALVLLITIVLIFLFYLYFNFKYQLNLGAEIKNVLISEDGQTAYLKLEGGSINRNITKIKFVFYDKNEKEYYYETTEGAREFSLFFKKSWLIFVKPSYKGEYDYEINAASIGLDSFRNIKRIEVFFGYETETGERTETPKLDTEEQIYIENIINENYGESDREETTFETCVNDAECLSAGTFCLGNKNYDCSYREDGCLNKVNEIQCGSQEVCVNGSGCIKIIECSHNNNCSYLNNACSYGICNTNKCELIFNYSINICRQAAGECDSEEYCTGSSASCPINKFKESGASCSLGVCDNNRCVECLYNSNCKAGEICENEKCVADICYEVDCSDYLTQDGCENNVCLSCNWNLSLRICQEPFLPTTNQISQFGITWTFDKQYGYGQFANGDYWVVGPVKIISIAPASVADSTGRIIHGSMLNPSPRLGYTQGYDSGMYGIYKRPEYYNPSLNVARPNNQTLSLSNPLTIQEGSLVSGISTPDTTGRTQLQTAAILTVLSNPAPEGSFRPSYSGNDKTIKFNKNQLNYSLLKKIAPVSNMPRLKQQAGDYQADSVERMFERPWLEHIPNFLGSSHHPKDNMIDYGREISTQIGIASLMLHLNFSDEEKETLLIRFVQLGIDNYGVVKDRGEKNWINNGGHASGRKWTILFSGLMLNNAEMKNIGEKSGDYLYSGSYGPGNEPPDYIHFGEDDQTFYISQEDIDATHSISWNPDSRDSQKIRYESEDIGLPEWGIVHSTNPGRSNKFWATAYRQVTGYGWGGWVLAVHIMNVKNLWNHPALFDYQDRYMEVTADGGAYPGWRQSNLFAENMWDTYRKDYGCVWKMNNPSNPYSQGSNECEMPSVKPASFWDEIIEWTKRFF